MEDVHQLQSEGQHMLPVSCGHRKPCSRGAGTQVLFEQIIFFTGAEDLVGTVVC